MRVVSENVCIFVEILKGAKSLRTQRNALKRDFGSKMKDSDVPVKVTTNNQNNNIIK